MRDDEEVGGSLKRDDEEVGGSLKRDDEEVAMEKYQLKNLEFYSEKE